MTPATLAGLSATMDRTELAERAGIDLRLLSVILHRAQAMKLASHATWQKTLSLTLAMAHDISSGDTCADCFGVGKRHSSGLYYCGCES